MESNNTLVQLLGKAGLISAKQLRCEGELYEFLNWLQIRLSAHLLEKSPAPANDLLKLLNAVSLGLIVDVRGRDAHDHSWNVGQSKHTEDHVVEILSHGVQKVNCLVSDSLVLYCDELLLERLVVLEDLYHAGDGFPDRHHDTLVDLGQT